MNEEDKRKRDEYLKVRAEYENARAQQSATLDKYIFTISTGAFGLSLLFIENLVKEIMKFPHFLLFSWIMFSLSVLSCLLSYISSKSAFARTIEEYDKMYEDENYTFQKPFQDFLTSVFNWYSLGFLVLGFASFFIFVFYNFLK